MQYTRTLVILALLTCACSDSTPSQPNKDTLNTATDLTGETQNGTDVNVQDADTWLDHGATTPCSVCALPDVCILDQCVAAAPCTPGETAGCAGPKATRVCVENAQGETGYVAENCPPGYSCDNGDCVAYICEPGKSYCEGLNAKKICNGDGTEFLAVETCPDGQYCSSGQCGSSCQIDPKFGANVGCEFWTVDLPNYPDPTLSPTPEDLPYAVVVSNPNEMDAEVTFKSFAPLPVLVSDPVVPAGESRVFLMPVVNVAKTGVSKSAIRMSSTRPVMVHQFNPWDNQFSNDASLLLPEPMLGSEHVILTWPTTALDLVSIPGFPTPASQNGYFTVVAIHDDTAVTFRVTAAIKEGNKVIAMGPGGLQSVTLQQGEVLNIESDPSGLFENSDLSGSTVNTTKPVAVFVGHEEAVIGEKVGAGAGDSGPCCADHLEEQVLPISVLGTSVLAVKAKPRGSEPDYWRIQAAQSNVTLTTDPPIPGVDGEVLKTKGDFVEVATADSFVVTGSGKIQVGQYLVSQGATEAFTGDPSLIFTIPVERYRDRYILMVPPDYAENWITVIAVAGSTVKVDGMALDPGSFTSFGSGSWSFAYVPLDAGIHDMEGDANFGVVAYGYNNAVSYGYPGGIGD